MRRQIHTRRRFVIVRASHGFTLIELLVALIVFGVLVAIAIPSYLGLRDQAVDTPAKANVRSAVPAAEGFYQQHGSYVGMDAAGALQTVDSTVSTDVVVSNVSATAYCLTDSKGSASTPKWYYAGPGGAIVSSKPTGC